MFNVPINDDVVFEGNENFTLSIDPFSLPNDVTVTYPSQTIVFILEDDGKLSCYYSIFTTATESWPCTHSP